MNKTSMLMVAVIVTLAASCLAGAKATYRDAQGRLHGTGTTDR